MQNELVGDWKGIGEDSGFVFEEIAENLVALGRGEEATPHFGRALELLKEVDWFVRDEPERLKRLEEMSG